MRARCRVTFKSGPWACFSKATRPFRVRGGRCQTAIRLFVKLIFKHVFIVRKTKRIAKIDGLEPRRCEDIIKGNYSTPNRSEKFRDF